MAGFDLSTEGLAAAVTLLPACGGDDKRQTPTGPTPTTNRAPEPAGSIPAQAVPLGESVDLDAAQYFSDPDGDALTFAATSSNPDVAAVSVTGSTVRIAGESLGRADIEITARDPQDRSATQSFPATVEPPTFTLSGQVSDSRTNGAAIVDATVTLNSNGQQESTATDHAGRYRFLNVSGAVTVRASAEPIYGASTSETTIRDTDATLDFRLDHTGTPPFSGTVWVSPDILGESDPTSLRGVSYIGRGEREIYDRRPDRWITVNAYLFDARYAGRSLEFQVNPEFGSRAAAREQVDRYAPAFGRLPAVLLSRAREVHVNAGQGDFGGNGHDRSFLLHTGQARQVLREGFLEEVLIHEGAHVSLDLAHASGAGWRAAQRADDGVFVSEYARDNPDREDVAESILPYFAVRYRPDRLSDADRAAITYAIPNRLVYFDDAGLDMAPYTPSTVAPVPGSLRSSPSTVPLLRPFEAPIPVR